jgi:tetratricopeptide (TPR) repeat protein
VIVRSVMKTGGSGSSSRWFVLGLLLLLPLGGIVRGQHEDDSSPYHQALLNYKSGNYADARLAIDEAEEQKPNDLATAVLKGRILTEQGDFADGETLLRRFLGPNGPVDVQLALGNLLLRKRDYSAAANMYEQALDEKPEDTDTKLKLVYAKVGTGDLIAGLKIASELKPLDPLNPSYYFAKAALAQAIGKTEEADQDIQTVRTIYGITVANHYLKTYLELFASPAKNGIAGRVDVPATNSAPAAPQP